MIMSWGAQDGQQLDKTLAPRRGPDVAPDGHGPKRDAFLVGEVNEVELFHRLLFRLKAAAINSSRTTSSHLRAEDLDRPWFAAAWRDQRPRPS